MGWDERGEVKITSHSWKTGERQGFVFDANEHCAVRMFSDWVASGLSMRVRLVLAKWSGKRSFMGRQDCRNEKPCNQNPRDQQVRLEYQSDGLRYAMRISSRV